jgi:radical SAM/Cys-rich protein
MKFSATSLSLFWLALSATVATAWVPIKKDHIPSTALKGSSSLPDFGKTSVEVDKIHLEPKKTKWRRQDLFGSSIVKQTLQELEDDEEFQATNEKLKSIGQEAMSKEERTKRRRALDKLGVPSFANFLRQEIETDDGTPFILKRKTPAIFQINIGLYCNQACAHCHVESSPLRTEEMMTADTAAECLKLLKNTPSITTLDITGGAPELNENFRYLVKMARSIRPDLEIIDRCNLTVLQEPGQEDLVEFLKENKVHVIASLPCYSADNVDTQRGNGVFERSIAALLALNDAGYSTDPGLQLDLVYNPLGAFLPPPQEKLEVQYKEQLAENFGILFDSLYTITNMPIKRFADFLHRRDELQGYMDLLVRNFNKDTVANLMCLDTISVGWDGKVSLLPLTLLIWLHVMLIKRLLSFQIYDCDFNQQLGYAVGVDSIHRGGKSVFDLESLEELIDVRIRTDNHCFGCTAGMGSS